MLFRNPHFLDLRLLKRHRCPGLGRAGTSTDAALANEKFQIKTSTFSKTDFNNTKFPDTVMKSTPGVMIIRTRVNETVIKHEASSDPSKCATVSLYLQY
jgi:carbamoylphosphate synthase large subunit